MPSHLNPPSHLSRWFERKPLILGHRGASHDAPENTLAAFELARQMGADGVELDTSLSRDGVPVVIHDLTLDKTTDGHGAVAEYTLPMLKMLDAGSSFDASFAGERIPTLDEAMEAIGKELFVNIELKSRSWYSDGLELAALKVIRRHNAADRVIISSFNPMTLRRFRRMAEDIAIGYLYSPDEPVYLRYGWFMAGLPHEARHPYHGLVNEEFMAWARSHQYRVNVWTVDDPARIAELTALGVDAIITNRPDVALQAVGRTEVAR
ncbi:MAG: glycerophosphodiester phosphodiesterase family protein [Anaerolineae bacterium]